MSRRAVVVLVVVATLLACAGSVAAQSPAPPASPEFLSRSAFAMSAEQFHAIADERFKFDANFGGELDVVDFVHGRLTFFANYQVTMGEEFRRFDPNQGNYILEGALSARLPGVELAGVFYHQSRHLSDRPKEFAIDWNMIGARAMRSFDAGRTRVAARADIRGVIQHSYVDYRWEFDGRVRVDRRLHPRVGLLASGGLRHLGVDGTRQRGGQTGFRAEGGVRFEGRGAAVELYLAAERRIDPYPLDFSSATWAAAGFRLMSR